MDRLSKVGALSNDSLGIVVRALGTNQLGYNIIKQVNAMMGGGAIYVTVFYDEHDRIPNIPYFPMMQTMHLWGFNGDIITTDVESTYTTLRIPTIKRRFFYVWNLEWVYNRDYFTYYSKVYNNDDVELIARSQSHFDILEQCWKKPIGIIDDFNYREILSTIA